jgi:hypothetical protein
MVWAGEDVLLYPFPRLGNGFCAILLEVGNSSLQGSGFAHGEEFGEECCGAFCPCVGSFLVLVEPLLHLPHEGEGKQTKLDAL